MDIVWEDPPKPRQSRNKWKPILATVRENPNVWAKVELDIKTSAGGVASTLNKRHGPEGFEFMSRGKCVYVRYVPKFGTVEFDE